MTTITLTRPRKRFDLRTAAPEIPTAPHVRAAAKRALDAGETHYTTRPGLNPLRRAIAEKLARENGIQVHPEREVLVTSGTREALFVALHVLLERGDEAVITGPAWRTYRDITRLAGGRPKLATADPDRGFALDRKAIAAALSKRTRVVVLANPSAPVGAVADQRSLKEIAELVVDRGLAVVSVETLEPLVFGRTHHSIGALPGMAERTVTINGFSEVHGLAGWRVGYAAGPESLMGPLTQLKQAMSICSAAVSQHAALAAITGPGEPVDEARKLVKEQRRRALGRLDRAGIGYVRPAAGYHALLDARPAGERAVFDRLRAAGVRVGRGSEVGADGWLWISLAEDPDVLDETIGRLRVAFDSTGGEFGHD
jgi:aminotransferase